jgi:tRNA-splicing ligase RtcB
LQEQANAPVNYIFLQIYNYKIMPYEELTVSTPSPILSWANHPLGSEEIKMAKNVASLPFVFKHVALMPDVHLGKGALVGSVIATKEAIIPAAIGVDIGCFVGETLVPLADGKYYPIQELANRDEEFIVYACNSRGKIVAAKATARLTRRNAPLVKVILDNDEQIICTPDHQFMLRDGTYQEAQHLQPERSLMPFYSQVDKDGYTLIAQPYSGKFNHKLVAVLPLDYTQDVYCLTVPQYHNFALKAGVFVHNCGMSAIKMPFNGDKLEGKLKKIRLDIEAAIPTGFNENKDVEKAATNWQRWRDFQDLHRGVQDLQGKAMKQMGSLGGGNHFLEVCLDTENQVWLMLHSGSRNIGNNLAQCHINTAKELLKMAANKLPDPDLAYFVAGTPEFQAYWRDLQWAQDYARFNREVMMARFKRIVEQHVAGGKPTKPLLEVNCHHNYAEKEVHFGEEVYVTRKGAVRATEQDYGIIPGSMGAKSYIVKGKGSANSFCSCSHGAGRLLSRNKAKNVYTLDDLIEQTKGVECRKDSSVLDEIPGAYKPIDEVMNSQSDLVEIVATLKQVVCVKG